MTRLGLKSNREGRNREASERKGSEKATKIGENELPFSIRPLNIHSFPSSIIGVLIDRYQEAFV